MMPTATVTRPFRGVPDGELYARDFVPGDEIVGKLADAMVAAGYAKKKAVSPPRNRADAPDRNRSAGSASAPAPASRKRKSKRSADGDAS